KNLFPRITQEDRLITVRNRGHSAVPIVEEIHSLRIHPYEPPAAPIAGHYDRLGPPRPWIAASGGARFCRAAIPVRLAGRPALPVFTGLLAGMSTFLQDRGPGRHPYQRGPGLRWARWGDAPGPVLLRRPLPLLARHHPVLRGSCSCPALLRVPR